MAGPLQSLVNRSPVPFTSKRQSFLMGGDGSSMSRADQEAQLEKTSTLFSIVDLIASKVAAADWHLYRKQGRTEEERTEVTDHPALVVWNSPASVDGQVIYTQDEFVEANQQHYELTGELDIVLERSSLGRLSALTDMWPVRPSRITPVKSRDKFVQGYVYKLGAEEIPLDVSQVIVEKRQNPTNPWRGLSPLGSLLMEIRGERAAAAWNAQFFSNGAVPGGTLELGLDAMLSDTEWDAMLRRWRGQHQGVSNSHRVALIEMGKYTENKIGHRDMEFVDLRHFNRESIMEAYRVSKANLGHVDDVNRSNNQAQEDRLNTEVIIPRLERWKKLLNRKLLPHFGPLTADQYEFDFDTPIVPDLVEEARIERMRSLSVAAFVREGFHSAETLEAFGFPPIPWTAPETAGAVADGPAPPQGD